MPVTPPTSVYDSVVEHDPEARVTWEAVIEAAFESALLMRILQKAALPEAEILQVRYDAGLSATDGRPRVALAEIFFSATPARAHSVVRKWEKIICVQRVSLTPISSLAQGLGSLPFPGPTGQPREPVAALD
jgi:hypothetical protein